MAFDIYNVPCADAYSASQDMLVQLGVRNKPIGRGSYAKVYEVDALTVVKYLPHVEEDSYFEYVKLLSKQKHHNPYTPVINAAYLLQESKQQKSAIVIMERLTPMAMHFGRTRAIEMEAERILRDSPRVGRAVSAMHEMHSLMSGCSSTPAGGQLAKAFSIIKKVLNKTGGIVDISEHNMMMRGNQLVFTDPTVDLLLCSGDNTLNATKEST